MKGLPTGWDIASKKNVKWVATLGSQSYGNLVVAGGKVFVGTNNESLKNPQIAGGQRSAHGVSSLMENSFGRRRMKNCLPDA
jgi:hypothetical protein